MGNNSHLQSDLYVFVHKAHPWWPSSYGHICFAVSHLQHQQRFLQSVLLLQFLCFAQVLLAISFILFLAYPNLSSSPGIVLSDLGAKEKPSSVTNTLYLKLTREPGYNFRATNRRREVDITTRGNEIIRETCAMQASGDVTSAEPHALPHRAASPSSKMTVATTMTNGDGSGARKSSVTKMALLNQPKTTAELLISGRTAYVPDDGLRYR